MDLRKCRVVCSGKIRQAAYDYLKDKVDLYSWQQRGRVPAEQWDAWLAEAEAIYSVSNIRIDEALLEKAPKLKVIAQASVGYDNIDIAACSRRGVKVGHTPGILVNDVADLAYGLMLDTARGIVRGHLYVAAGTWAERKAPGLGVTLYGKTVGIVGMGDIGSAVVARAKASGMKVLYHNRSRRLDDEAIGASYATLPDLLAQSDFVVVTVTLNESTKGMFNRETFAMMKDGARFINVSRGKVVDTEALTEALASGKLAAAALDVTDPEPFPGDHPLLATGKVTITPHIATATGETKDAMSLVTADNILAALEGTKMPAQVPVRHG